MYKFHAQADLSIIELFEENNDFLGKEGQYLEFFMDAYYDTPSRLLMKKNLCLKIRTLGSRTTVIVESLLETSPEGLLCKEIILIWKDKLCIMFSKI